MVLAFLLFLSNMLLMAVLLLLAFLLLRAFLSLPTSAFQHPALGVLGVGSI
jgi:hypothetical protein